MEIDLALETNEISDCDCIARGQPSEKMLTWPWVYMSSACHICRRDTRPIIAFFQRQSCHTGNDRCFSANRHGWLCNMAAEGDGR